MNDFMVSKMKYGNKVAKDGVEYRLIDVPDQNGLVSAVTMADYEKWDRLRAWIHNYIKSERFKQGMEEKGKPLEMLKAEKREYEVKLDLKTFKPADMVRFIEPDYKEKFRIRNGEQICIIGTDSKLYTVVFIDDYHMELFQEKDSGMVSEGVYHICEFAEFCSRNGLTVRPAGKEVSV